IARLPRPDRMVIVLDAAQALGQIPVDVAALGCDALVATCRKWLSGPRNNALFWLGEKLGGAEAVAELTPTDANVALRLGLGTALAEARDIPARRARIARLREGAASALGDHPALQLQPGETGALAITLAEDAAKRAEQALAQAGIIAKFPNPARDEPAAPQPSPGTRMLRITPNVYNTEADIAALADTLVAALG
ncbi:MAG: aminotransferase class V-fold PLP-dependent enzyme, partial [Pseudomonadota bacterium]